MGHPDCAEPSPQRGGGRLSQQDGQDRLGDDEERNGLSTQPGCAVKVGQCKQSCSALTKEIIQHDCKANRLMANRSNRRQQNPRMSKALEAGKPIGSWRANSPLWSCLPKRGCRYGPNI